MIPRAKPAPGGLWPWTAQTVREGTLGVYKIPSFSTGKSRASVLIHPFQNHELRSSSLPSWKVRHSLPAPPPQPLSWNPRNAVPVLLFSFPLDEGTKNLNWAFTVLTSPPVVCLYSSLETASSASPLRLVFSSYAMYTECLTEHTAEQMPHLHTLFKTPKDKSFI